jgi:hypothetical protein
MSYGGRCPMPTDVLRGQISRGKFPDTVIYSNKLHALYITPVKWKYWYNIFFPKNHAAGVGRKKWAIFILGLTGY